MAKIGSEALVSNPALKPLEVLIGKWKTFGGHPLMPGIALHGHTSFEWIEGGSFILMRSEIDEPGIPSGIAIIGSDDVRKQYYMIYFDERGVSRMYDLSIKANELTWWRDTPSFSQRMVTLIKSGGKTLVSEGEFSKDGGPWQKDLALTYTRIK